jgi:outer membrane protein, multidrug efflux system
MKLRINGLFCIGLVMIIAGVQFSCKSIDIPVLPDLPKVPATFLGLEDSISAGDIVWQDFIIDPDLADLIDEALQNNPDVLMAMERIEIARAQFQIQRGALHPTFDAIVRYRSGDIRPNLLNGTINGDRNVINRIENNFVGFQANWEIDVWGKLKNRRQAAKARFLASEKAMHLLRTLIVAEVATLYYELLGLDMELQTIEKNIEFQSMALELIKIQKIAGRVTELAVQQFASQLLSTRSLRYIKEQEIIEVENQLNYILGRFPESIPRPSSFSDLHLPEKLLTGLPSQMMLRRPDIREAEYRLNASGLELEAARKEFFPNFNFTPYIGLNDRSIPAAFQFPGAITVGLLGGITGHILQQNVIRAGFEQAKSHQKIALYEYQQSILNGFNDIITVMQRIDNLNKIYELKQEETEVLLNAVSIANDLFRSGYAAYLEVITAQSRVLEAELELATTRKEIFQSVVHLYRALGGGWKEAGI